MIHLVRTSSPSGAVCQMAARALGYVVRPRMGNLNWGGVNSATCAPPGDQRMDVYFVQ
jgi:hypothetical protein